MPDFPISLDKLISYIKAQRPEGDPLEQLSEAVNVAARLEEQSDAVIGYFVEQARASGESWSQIGASMGVSKQAAQKRFVLRADDLGAESKAFSRFTPRARNAVATAGQTAAAAGADAVDATYLAAGLLTEPEGLAVKIVRRLGVTEKDVYDLLGFRPAPQDLDSDTAALCDLSFTDAAKAAFRVALKTALAFGHNYIGTEHLLIGVLSGEDEAIGAVKTLGLTPDLMKSALAVELAQYKLDRQRHVG